jgi:putative ABC transport system permease protein
MYIFKNAMRSIHRSKGRNILIGVILFVIAFSCCIGLSIRQAAESAREDMLDGMEVTAQISVDRQSMMQDMQTNGQEEGEAGETQEKQSFDADSFREKMQDVSSLTVEEMLTYAQAECVEDFYYSSSVSINGSDSLEPVDTSTQESSDTETDTETDTADTSDPGAGGQPGGQQMEGGDAKGGDKGFLMGNMGSQGDFTLVGYSSYSAMTDFLSGSCSLSEGAMFTEGESDGNCIITDELAAFNNLSVGDAILLTNPNDEEETHTLTVSGIYSNSQSTVQSSGRMGGFSTSSDPANAIYVSYETLSDLLADSEAQAETSTDESTGMTRTTALPSQESGTYVFQDVTAYEAFEAEARELGLSEDYAITSEDVSSYEESLLPLENLSKMAKNFLIVILAIGAIVLMVLNIFNIRERKYEIGVLTAIGMKKRKVAAQFMLEIFTLTVVAVLLGGTGGAIASVPVTNALLEGQVEAQTSSADALEANFGKETQMSQDKRQNAMGGGQNMEGKGGFFEDTKAGQYISEVSGAANLTVFLQLILVALGLTLVTGFASVLFIMRYEPLKILANRD